jgi:hypothetical protein
MLKIVKRRPSFATGIALLALFIALGGPAEAQRLLGKGDVNSRVVKDRSLKTRDLSRRAVRDLQATPNMSISEVKIANGAVTPGKLARGAVGSAAIGDRTVSSADLTTGAVGSAQLADRSLGAADIARYWGRFEVRVGVDPTTGAEHGIAAHSCWAGDPGQLWPEREGADISDDLVIVNPDGRWPPASLSLTVRNSGQSRFTLIACNPTGTKVDTKLVGFRYVVIDLP